ncbi:ChaN family lipoprotein, partial [Arthrospira platensis SPKY2]
DIELPSYKAMLEMMGGHAGERMPKAQAIKDATMAYFIQKNSRPNHIFLHLNGTYHSDLYEGIFWYLKQQNAKMRILTIATVTKAHSLSFDPKDKNKADFILVIDEDVTKSYAQ